LVLGSSGATASITPPEVAGNATVSGTVALSWQMIVMPDLVGYPSTFDAGDTWSFTLNGTPVTKLVGTDFTSATSVAEFLAAAIAARPGITSATAQADGSIIVVASGGSLTQLGALKWTRATPYDTAPTASPRTPDGRDHYIQVVINLTGGLEDV